MTIKELMKFLQNQQERNILLDLQGIVITSIIIHQMQVKKKENKLLLENKENTNNKIGFNLSQLMKITKIKENEILLEFDPLQKVMITIQDEIKKQLMGKKMPKDFSNYLQCSGIN